MAVTDAVVTRQVRGCLGRRNDIVSIETVARVRQRYFTDFASVRLIERDRLLHRCADFRIEPFTEILLRNTELPWTASRSKFGLIIRSVRLERSGISFV